MESTGGKEKIASSNKTLEKEAAAENSLDETLPSDAMTVEVEELKVDDQLEDKVDMTVDVGKKGNSEGMSGEEDSEKDEAINEDSEGLFGEETERVTKLDNDYQNTIVEEMNGDNKVELEKNKFEDDEIDDQGEMPWDDDEENTDLDNEERFVDENDFSDEEATEEDNEDDEVSEEEGTKEDDEDEVDDEEEDGEENTPEEKEIAKHDATETNAKEDGRKTEQHNPDKLEVNLKNNKKSSEASRKKKVQIDRSKNVDLKDQPESPRKRKVKKRVESMGMIFMCSSKTKKDCYQYRVLGLPESKKGLVEKIYTGMRLFLYDVDLKLMYGIYKAARPGGYNIEPRAFKSQFPCQVRFKILENCLPLAEEKFKKIIKDNYYTKTKFDCQLNSEQVKNLCKLFVASSKGRPPKKSGQTCKAEQQPVQRERTSRKQRAVMERRPPLREEVKYDRPRKRPRKVLSPARQRPAPLPPIVPSSYSFERTSDVDAYRRDPYVERCSPFRDRRDWLLDRHDPYGDRRDPPMDGRDPYLDRLYVYRDRRDPYIERRDPYSDDQDPYLKCRDPYRDGHDPVELPDLYRDRQDPYLERRDSHRDGRDAYLERRLPYRDPAPSELYRSTYRRDLLSDRGVEYRRQEELLERRDLHPLSSFESRLHHDIVGRDSYVSTRERLAYAEPVYPAGYPSMTGLHRM